MATTPLANASNWDHVNLLPNSEQLANVPAVSIPLFCQSGHNLKMQRNELGANRFQRKLNQIYDEKSMLSISDKHNLPEIKKIIENVNEELDAALININLYAENMDRHAANMKSLEPVKQDVTLEQRIFLNENLKYLESTGKHLDQKLDKVLNEIKDLQEFVDSFEIQSKKKPENMSNTPTLSSSRENKSQAILRGQTTTPLSPKQGGIPQRTTQDQNTIDPTLLVNRSQPKPVDNLEIISNKVASTPIRIGSNHAPATAQPTPLLETGTPEHAFNQHQQMANRQQAIQLAMTSMSNLQNIVTTMQQSTTAQVSAMCNQILDGVKTINDLMKKGGAMSSGAIGQ